jgi:hypothetical protein
MRLAGIAVGQAVASAGIGAFFGANTGTWLADSLEVTLSAHRHLGCFVIAVRRFGVGATKARESTARRARGSIGRASSGAGASALTCRAAGSRGTARASRSSCSASSGTAIGGVGTVVRAATERCKGRTPQGDPKRTSTVQQ